MEWTDNVRLLERLSDAGFLSRDEAEFLKQAYVGFRAQVHRAALQEQEARIPAAAAAETRARVQAIWRKLMES
ncbi:hypothetical protein [Methylogaea oryzae]|uniref:hypothetical protein n=1 Tax=Methylogaea oryzae TaxID=1295382 RepID=UPI0006D2BC14|nr:hypothetical protein [Methylogaea oryzae]